MAAGDKWVGCANPSIGVLEMINAISVKVTATNVQGIRTYITTTAGENLSPGLPCGASLEDLDLWLRSKLVEDANGDPALHLIVAT